MLRLWTENNRIVVEVEVVVQGKQQKCADSVCVHVCVCEMWWKWCWMENSGNVVLEEERNRNVEVVVQEPQRYRTVVEGLLAMV